MKIVMQHATRCACAKCHCSHHPRLRLAAMLGSPRLRPTSMRQCDHGHRSRLPHRAPYCCLHQPFLRLRHSLSGHIMPPGGATNLRCRLQQFSITTRPGFRPPTRAAAHWRAPAVGCAPHPSRWGRLHPLSDSTSDIDTGNQTLSSLGEIWHHQSCGHLRAGRALGSNSPSAAAVMVCPASRDALTLS
jgi:hypothetical protein